jgi:hypothetical protein
MLRTCSQILWHSGQNPPCILLQSLRDIKYKALTSLYQTPTSLYQIQSANNSTPRFSLVPRMRICPQIHWQSGRKILEGLPEDGPGAGNERDALEFEWCMVGLQVRVSYERGG